MKMRYAVVVLVAFLVAWMLAPVVSAGGDAAKGKATFTTKCSSCHALDGEGKPAIAKMMKVEMKNLGSKEVQGKKDADLKKDMTQGVGKMPAVKGLTDDDVANLIAFMRTLAKK